MVKHIIEYLSSKNNLKTVVVDGLLLHSKYDPIKEADRIVEKEFEPNFAYVLFGFGLGYIKDALLKRIDDPSKLIIIDPIFSLLDQDDKSHHVIEKIDEKEIETYIANQLPQLSKKVKVVCSPNYEKLFQNEYKMVLQIIKNVQMLNLVTENTVRYFADSWQENSIHNLANVYTGISLEALNKYYTCPVIVAAGGPSLTKQLPLLKEIEKNVILIAAGSTVNSLLKNEIEPDYIVTVDGSLANYNHFKDIGKIKSKLIFAITSNYKIQYECKNEKYAFVDANNVEYREQIKKLFDVDLPLILGGGSVANFCYSIASYITTGPIAMIGQDLAYTDNKSHDESNKHFIEINDTVKQERRTFELEGYYGDKVLTDYSFLSMKKGFEMLHYHNNNDNEIYNCTEGGVKIEGIEQLPFRTFVERFVDSSNIINMNSEVKSRKVDYKLFYSIMNKNIKIYDDVIKEIKNAIIFLKTNNSTIYFDKKVLRGLEKIDAKLKRAFIELSIEYITGPITIDVLRNYEKVPNEKPEESYKRVFNQNLELYTRLLEVIEKSKRYTLEATKEAENIFG
ncbi:6-hydroxymethylpterin diphosphokinase MptE-like protein [Lysinibacillus sp. fls2-241-R2A-57]|uniref:motility associated factor glycosyltransferase family protein n=1 Tax=Lysinibacillus sp. fls2-241-R2A-57 TaxID=3040292 RepID=UPI002556F9BD|nr:6-hydroxymethylpterin diphosphokinase MptE-like protein [Lysinibacillus sp. fls2-241-R2A-57]